MRRLFVAAQAALLGFAISGVASAQGQDYASRPIRIVVGFPPGGDTDVFARMIGDRLKDRVGQPGVVENRPGAAGAVAWPALAGAAPDGYTLGLLAFTNGQLPALFKSVPTDWYRQVSPIIRTHATFGILVGSAQSPAKTLQQLIAYAKANPGKLNAGGVGRSLPTLLMTQMAGIEITEVSYKGIADINNALFANEVQVTINSLGFAKPHIETGRMVPLAVLNAQRSPHFPNVPALAEALPGYDAGFWFAFAAPAGTPRAIVDRLHGAISSIVSSAELQKYLGDQLAVTLNSSPDETAKFLEADTQRWLKAAASAKIAPQ